MLGDLLARAAYSTKPDGFPTGSYASTPPLSMPAGSGGLRTHPYDPLPPHHEHGYIDDTSVEQAATDRMNDICDECSGTGHDPRSVEMPPCRRCDGTGRRWADPIGQGVRDIISAVVEMRKLGAMIDRKRQMVLHAADQAKDRPLGAGAGPCHCCNDFVTGVGEDRLKSLLCPPCYMHWGSWRLDHPASGDPKRDMQAYEDHRRAELAAQKKEGGR